MHSNTTLVKVKSFSTFASNFVISIQIQLLLKLNIYLGGVTATFLNSNTTLVKVKLFVGKDADITKE